MRPMIRIDIDDLPEEGFLLERSFTDAWCHHVAVLTALTGAQESELYCGNAISSGVLNGAL